MAIERIELTNFGVFEKAAIEFSPGLNVFIGENGTGKSHLMKLMYAVRKTYEDLPHIESEADGDHEHYRYLLTDKLVGAFKPDDSDVSRLVWRPKRRAGATIVLSGGAGSVSFKVGAGQVRPQSFSRPRKPFGRVLFVPAHEALALYEGFIAAWERRELAFDETLKDLCVALSGSRLKGRALEAARRLAEPLVSVLQGEVVLEGGRFYLQGAIAENPFDYPLPLEDNRRVEAFLMAEGHRKLATLVQLLLNGSLTKGGILFWDEPEANLNPKLIKVVADFLLSLADQGVQVFISTHDYLLTGELSLAAEYATRPKSRSRFFAFTRTLPQGPVAVESGATLNDLEHNPILQEFAAHYEREQTLFHKAQ